MQVGNLYGRNTYLIGFFRKKKAKKHLKPVKPDRWPKLRYMILHSGIRKKNFPESAFINNIT